MSEGERSARRSVVTIALAGVAIVAAAGAYWVFGVNQSGPVQFGDLSNYVVIQSTESPEIALVDTVDDSLTGKVTLPVQPDMVVVSQAVDRIVFSNRAAKTLSIYDLATQEVEATIELGFSPDNIVLSPDALSVAVAGTGEGVIGIVRLADNRLVGTADGLIAPRNMSFSDDSEYLFVSDGVGGQIRMIDVFSARQLDPIELSIGGEADADSDVLSAVTRTPNGFYGLSVDRLAGRMSLINFRDWREVDTIDTGNDPTRPYGTADGRFMLVANNADETVQVLSTDYFDLEATLPGVPDVTSIATGYFETLAYVVSASQKKAIVVDLETMQPAGEVSLPGTPGPAVVTADGLKLYVALTDTDELAVVDVRNRQLIKTVAGVGKAPLGVTMAQTNNYCH